MKIFLFSATDAFQGSFCLCTKNDVLCSYRIYNKSIAIFNWYQYLFNMRLKEETGIRVKEYYNVRRI